MHPQYRVNGQSARVSPLLFGSTLFASTLVLGANNELTITPGIVSRKDSPTDKGYCSIGQRGPGLWECRFGVFVPRDPHGPGPFTSYLLRAEAGKGLSAMHGAWRLVELGKAPEIKGTATPLIMATLPKDARVSIRAAGKASPALAERTASAGESSKAKHYLLALAPGEVLHVGYAGTNYDISYDMLLDLGSSPDIFAAHDARVSSVALSAVSVCDIEGD